jgi:hypothetical protein
MDMTRCALHRVLRLPNVLIYMIFLKIWAAMLFEPEKAWLHEVSDRQTDRHPVLYTAQWLRQLRIFPMFGRRAYFYKLWNNTSYLIFLLILKCLAGKDCCVAIVDGSNNMWKAKIKRLKLDLVSIFEIFDRQIYGDIHWDTCDVSFIRDFVFTTEFLAGKFFVM